MNILNNLHIVPLVYPDADAFAGTVTSDVVKVPGTGLAAWIYKGVGATGTSTITVLACDDVTPSNTTAVAFRYCVSTTPDVWGAWIEATTAGFTLTAGSNQVYEIAVDASQFGAEGYAYGQIKAIEVVDSPVDACILGAITKPIHAPQPYTVLT